MEAAKKEKCFTYQRRRPELTPCYRIVQEELETFLADRQAEGRPVPEYVVYIVFVPHSFGKNCPRLSSATPGRNVQKNLYLTAENRSADYSDWVFDNNLFIESAGVFLLE